MDISTIFYFPNSLTFEDYSEKLNNGEIAARTIVFADAQKAIYKGGKKYGGMSTQEFHDMIDALYNNSWISDEINGVKGDIISASQLIDGLNTSLIALTGRLNTEITNRDENIKNKIQSLFEDSEWLQTNFPQGVTNWDSGWNSKVEEYLQSVGYWTEDSQGNTITQWSKLQQSLSGLETSVNSLKVNGTLTEALSTSIGQLVDNKVAALNLGTTYATKQEVSDASGKADDAEEVIQWMYSGLKSEASEEKTFSQLSSMAKLGLSSAIADIRTQVDKVANGDFVAQTEIASKVGNTIASMLLLSSESNGLASMSAKLNTVETAAGDNSDKISAIMLGITGSESTANIQTRLSNVVSGFVSTSDVSTIEGDAVSTAKSEIYSAISAKDSNDNFISLAALKTQSDADHAQVSNIALIQSDVNDLKQSSINSAGFVAKADLGSSVAELFAQSGDGQNATAKANVVATVANNKSLLNLTADDVNITGYLTGGNASFKGNIEASSFTTGASNEVGIGVMSGEFDETIANTHKAYFAYDSAQGGITMWYYQANKWKRLDLANAMQDTGATFIERMFFLIPDETITVMPNNLSYVTLYYNRHTGLYYNTESTSDPVVSGTYFWISGDIKNTPTYYRKNDMPNGQLVKVPQANIHSTVRGNLNNLFYMAWQMNYNVYKYTCANGAMTEVGRCRLIQALTSIGWHEKNTAVPANIYIPYDETATLVTNEPEHNLVVYRGDDTTTVYRWTGSGDNYLADGNNSGQVIRIINGKVYSNYAIYSESSYFNYWVINPVFAGWDESYGPVNQYAQVAYPNGKIIRIKSNNIHNSILPMSLSAAITVESQPHYNSSGGYSWTNAGTLYSADDLGVARIFNDLTYPNAITE